MLLNFILAHTSCCLMARTILTTCHGIVRIRMLTYIYMSMKEGLPTLHIILYEKAELKKQPPINFRQIKNIKSERERERERGGLMYSVVCGYNACTYHTTISNVSSFPAISSRQSPPSPSSSLLQDRLGV
jgi:hypothetical protein